MYHPDRLSKTCFEHFCRVFGMHAITTIGPRLRTVFAYSYRAGHLRSTVRLIYSIGLVFLPSAPAKNCKIATDCYFSNYRVQQRGDCLERCSTSPCPLFRNATLPVTARSDTSNPGSWRLTSKTVLSRAAQELAETWKICTHSRLLLYHCFT